MTDIVLNPGQEAASKKMQDFLTAYNTVGEHFVLAGGPGTGKTFLTKYALKGAFGTIAGVALSHAAKNVLKQHLPSNINCYTLAAFLGLKMSNDNTGKVVFKENSTGYIPMERYDTMILDEISMIDDGTYEHIMRIARNAGVRIIALGDMYQLPPVEQDTDSNFFKKIDSTLTQPMRFSGPIDDLANVFRKEIGLINSEEYFDKYILNSYTNREDNYDNTAGTGYKFINSIDEMMEQASDGFKSNKGNVNHSRILAFKNHTVDLLNTGIREMIYGKGLAQFESGEILIANNNVYAGPSDGFKSGSPLIYNGQILEIESFIEDGGPADIPCVYLKIKGIINPVNHPIRAVVSNDGGHAIDLYRKEAFRLKQNALQNPSQWENYFNFINSFLQYDYAYAINLYRAQGSTLDTAYVLDGEVTDVKPLTWKQKFQALYVAMTRPKNNLIFYNKKF